MSGPLLPAHVHNPDLQGSAERRCTVCGAHYLAAVVAVTDRCFDCGGCRRCAGTGEFVTMVVNGVPTGPGGLCYRCRGKGWQTNDDRRRNRAYDMYGRRA